MPLDLKPDFPIHTELWSEDSYEKLDKGIRYAVKILHFAGIPTSQSCEGGENHAYEYPTIDMVEGRVFEATQVLERNAIKVVEVSSIWRINDGVPDERIWRVVLKEPLFEFVDKTPMFIVGNLHSELWKEVDKP